MPGKLSSSHEKYEEQCSLCHDRSDRNRQTQLCLDCHKDIAGDLRQQQGFHGRVTGIEQLAVPCLPLRAPRAPDAHHASSAREQFDHGSTDFALKGAHAAVACAELPRRRQALPRGADGMRRLPSQAGAARRQARARLRLLPRRAAWRHVTYDHGKTAFPLHDKHAEAPCAACHFGNRYKDTPHECVSCHAPDDVHHGERGPKCADCHPTKGWKNSKFDHKKETGFALLGRARPHRLQRLSSQRNLKDKLPRECAGCHQGAGLARRPPGRGLRQLPRQREVEAGYLRSHARHQVAARGSAPEGRLSRLPHRARRHAETAAPTASAATAPATCTPASSARTAISATPRQAGAPASASTTT